MKHPAKRRRDPRQSRGPLYVIAAILAASALARVGAGAGPALAKAAFATQQPISAKPQQCQKLAGLDDLLNELKGRKAALDRKEASLAEQERAITLAKQKVGQELEKLRDAEKRLDATMARAQTAAEDDLSRLTAVYENMKPKEAAALFDAMSPDFAAGFIGRMRPDSAARIMAGLSPESAYSISVILAGRNARAGKK